MASPEVAALVVDRGNFERLLQHLQSHVNEERARAEELFNQCKKHADPCVTQLMATLRQSQDLSCRSLSAVLLRKVLTKDDPSLWPQLTPTTQGMVRTELLNCVKEETQRQILRKVCDTVAELAGGTYETQGWPELLPFMNQCVQSGDERLVQSALQVFSELARFLLSSLRPHLDGLQAVLGGCLNSNSLDVRIGAMRAVTAFITELESPGERDKFQGHIPAMLSTLGVALNHSEEAAAQDAVEMFIEIAECHPRFLRRQLGEVLNAMLQVAEAGALESSTRQLAAEFVVTLCEARDKAPGMMRKLPQGVGRLFQCLVSFLLDIEDDPRWHSAEDETHETEGEGELFEVGQECLDRMALALGGNTIAPLARQLFPQLMGEADWAKRHAALICLAQIAEGCVKAMSADLPALVSMCMLALRDAHPRVRWAACQAVGQICTDLGPKIQEQHHAAIIPALVAAMGDFNAPRVQAHASAAVVNFSENCDSAVMAPYLDALIAALMQLLQRGKKLVQEGALTAMASVADCSQSHFVKYYDSCMPLLTQILVNATDKSHRLLRAKALECVSLVGMAVGRDRFRNDAHQVMKFIQLLQAQGAEESDDPTSGYVLQAGARLCKALGEEFLPYMHMVMPPLLHAAQLKPDVSVADVDSDEEGGEGEDDEEVETLYIGDRKISIRTSVLEEKATACNMLCCYVDELKEGFYPYVEQVTGIMVPLLKFYFHEDVRLAAVQALPELLRSAVLAAEKGVGAPPPSPEHVKQMLGYIWAPLIEAMVKEPDVEILSQMIQAADGVVDVARGPALLPVEQLAPLFEQFKAVFKASEGRRAERLVRQQQEDFDEEEAEALEDEVEQEDNLLDELASCLSTILKLYGDAAMPLLEQLLVPIGQLLDKSRSAEERRIAVCIMDDLLEYCPQGSVKYMGNILPVVLDAAGDPDANLRQCGMYGLGVVAQHRPEHFKPHAAVALQRMMAVISDPAARSEENEMATDNAVSAMGKVLEFHSDCVDGAAVGAAWLAALPVVGDTAEAKVVHAQLARMLQQSDTRVLGINHANLPTVVAVILKVLAKGEELVDTDTASQLLKLLQQMQGALPQDVFQNIYAQLPAAEQAHLTAMLQGSAPPVAQ